MQSISSDVSNYNNVVIKTNRLHEVMTTSVFLRDSFAMADLRRISVYAPKEHFHEDHVPKMFMDVCNNISAPTYSFDITQDFV